jgi:2-oxo-4-hydroxy-4-carboxy-5-ureidoimidazoline decarboxylase
MAMPERLTLDVLNQVSAADFVAALGNVFEHSPWVVEAVAQARPFASLAALRDALVALIGAGAPEQRMMLIRAHPDLADRVRHEAELTAESVAEQDGAGLDRLSEAEFAEFDQLNSAYREKFGFPFILGVRRHTKDSVLDVFERRLVNLPEQEQAEAIREISRIASLRLAALVDGDDTLRVHGRLSTHVIDKHSGQPADGILVELIERSRRGEDRLILQTATNADGRTDPALIEGRPVPIGLYELRFHIGAYYTRRGLTLGEPAFFDIVTVQFGVAAPEAHLHVPLLMTPWGYSTYRGS